MHGEQHRSNAHNEYARPHQFYNAPGDQIRKAGNVAYHARHQPAHRGGIVKAERELLQPGKGVLPDVVAHIHFQPSRAAHIQEYAHALQNHACRVQQAVAQKPLGGAAADKMIDGVARELRIEKVNAGHHQKHGEHAQHGAPMAQRIGDQALPQARVDFLIGLVAAVFQRMCCHYATPPFGADAAWAAASKASGTPACGTSTGASSSF